MVAPWWEKACPSCHKVTLGSYNQPGALLSSILTGRFLVGGAKAVGRLAQGGASAYDWVKCGNCAGIFIACENCAYVWRPAEWPRYGDSIKCPHCGLDLV
jgi:hypothetical protein